MNAQEHKRFTNSSCSKLIGLSIAPSLELRQQKKSTEISIKHKAQSMKVDDVAVNVAVDVTRHTHCYKFVRKKEREQNKYDTYLVLFLSVKSEKS